MPLIKSKSKSAREKNIATEIAAGRPVKQAVAIGYSEQRAAGGHAADKERARHKSIMRNARKAAGV